jgi:hypothetical protein
VRRKVAHDARDLVPAPEHDVALNRFAAPFHVAETPPERVLSANRPLSMVRQRQRHLNASRVSD